MGLPLVTFPKITCLLVFSEDSDCFLRYLTNDDPAKANRIEKLFDKAETQEFTLVTSHLVIAELVWTLESYYHLSPPVIEQMLLKIINTPFIEVSRESLIIQALDLYVTRNIDFVDAYNAYFMLDNGVTRIYTDDARHFKRVDWVEIKEP